MQRMPRWRFFEKEVAAALKEVGCQHVGRSLLSGVSGRHQFEIVTRPPRTSLNDFILAECKYRRIGKVVSKPDVMIFNQKTVDISLRGELCSFPLDGLYRLFVSNVPLDHSAFRFCLINGIKVITGFHGSERYSKGVTPGIPVEVAYCRLVDQIMRDGHSVSKVYGLMERLHQFCQRTWYPVHERVRSRASGRQIEKEYLMLLRKAHPLIGTRW